MKNIKLNYALENYIKEWVDYLKNNKKCSQNTLCAYFTDVLYFLLFISEAYQEELTVELLKEITIQDMRSWLAYRRKQNKKSSSSSRAMASVRNFFSYLKLHKVVMNENIFLIKIKNKEKSLPRSLSLEDAFKAIEEIQLLAKRPWIGLRDRAILFLLYGCGLRISEVLAITKSDVRGDEAQILIKGKGGHERMVPVLDVVYNAVQIYIEACPHDISSGPIFRGNSGKILNPDVFRCNLRKLKYLISLPDYTSPHAFRHSFATHLLKQNGEIKLIQEVLGHKNLSTTQKYTKVDLCTITSNYYLYHPKTKK